MCEHKCCILGKGRGAQIPFVKQTSFYTSLLENCGRGEGLGLPCLIAVAWSEQGLAPLRIVVEVKVLVRHIL